MKYFGANGDSKWLHKTSRVCLITIQLHPYFVVNSFSRSIRNVCKSFGMCGYILYILRISLIHHFQDPSNHFVTLLVFGQYKPTFLFWSKYYDSKIKRKTVYCIVGFSHGILNLCWNVHLIYWLYFIKVSRTATPILFVIRQRKKSILMKAFHPHII